MINVEWSTSEMDWFDWGILGKQPAVPGLTSLPPLLASPPLADRNDREEAVQYISNRPHPPSPSPKERERCCISLIVCITTTSSLYLCSAFSETLIDCRVFEKRGLCSVGFPLVGKSEGGSLLNTFEDSNLIIEFSKSEGCAQLASPLWGSRKGALCSAHSKTLI